MKGARPVAYDYIKRMYGFEAKIGTRVRHTVINRDGVIARENKSAGHYVQVRFDGDNHAKPCHPDELVIHL